MKKLLLFITVIFLFAGCKKTIERIKQDMVINAMTDGQWIITSFKKNGTDITSDFTGYKFQYYKDKTVDAIKDGVVQMTGTWDGDASSMTTWANFTGSTAPLNMINGSWHIDNNSWTFVEATQSGTDTKRMRLDKQ